MIYRQVLDFATSVDYNPNSEESIRFFMIVQNKLHFAAHGTLRQKSHLAIFRTLDISSQIYYNINSIGISWRKT